MEQVILRCGLPFSLYTDRHGVFQAPPGREGQRPPTQFARAMTELGINQVFARSPQAKGRVKCFAGTFQDRLVTELRHAAAATIAEAQAVLDRYLPGFNARFRVEAAQSEPAYRAPDPALDLGAILAFRQPRTVARDNTVKYRWRTLQLLPGPERTSYAGARVDVVERADGVLSVRHHGKPIATRQAPPLAGTLRTAQAELASHPDHERIVTGRGSGGALPQTPAPGPDNGAVDPAANGAAPGRAVNGRPLRPPTPRQLARWKAIQQAQLQGLSIRATARLLGVSHVTVSNYVRANGVPGRRTSAASSLQERPDTDKVAAQLDCQNRCSSTMNAPFAAAETLLPLRPWALYLADAGHATESPITNNLP